MRKFSSLSRSFSSKVKPNFFSSPHYEQSYLKEGTKIISFQKAASDHPEYASVQQENLSTLMDHLEKSDSSNPVLLSTVKKTGHYWSTTTANAHSRTFFIKPADLQVNTTLSEDKPSKAPGSK